MHLLRKFISARQAGRLSVLAFAYVLALQGLMSSVGLGMSAFAAPNQDGAVICSHVLQQAQDGERQKPNPQPDSTPQCPFCFVAAQTAGLAALAGEAPAVPAYIYSPAMRVSNSVGEDIIVPQARHTVGVPRAPPHVSV